MYKIQGDPLKCLHLLSQKVITFLKMLFLCTFNCQINFRKNIVYFTFTIIIV